VADDRLLEQLKKDLSGDFKPVKPLQEPWKRALWLFPVSLLFMEITLAVFHLRPDYADLGPLALWGFCFLQIIACYLVFAASLEVCIPGSARAPIVLGCIGLLGLAIHLVASWRTFQISPNWPNPAHEWRIGAACMSAIGILGILALLFGFFLARAGLPIRARAVGLLLGLGSGLAAEAAWRLHCPYSSWNHILLFHSGTVVIVVAIGLAIGYLWKQKSSHS
jgi:hypothetical protein